MLTENQRYEIAGYLMGTCSGVYDESVCQEYGIDMEELEQILVECEVFLCDGCGWYADHGELNNLGHEDLCDQCHEEKLYEDKDYRKLVEGA